MDLIGFVVWMFLVCSMKILNNNGVEANILSDLEEFEINKKLELINKPAVEIIKTIHGDTYGCVDFFKQPAFDDPSLQNHTFHYKMRPKWYPKGFGQRNTSNRTFGFIWENGVGCPEGTVPIQRVTKGDLIRMDSLTPKHYPRGSTINDNQAHHFAVTRTKGKDRTYYGAAMDAGLNNPTVKNTQFSACRMHIQIGNDYIQAGWTVNPFTYPDTRTRLYVYTRAGESGCYNSLCGVGIISVRPDIPLGLVFEPVSVRGHTVHFKNFAVFKDKLNGNWWLRLYGGEEVGFWPEKRFGGGSATEVEWGGEVYTESPPSPPMGNGYFPKGNLKLDAFIIRISVVDRDFRTDTKVENTESYSDNSHGYKVRDSTESWYKHTGHLIVYGGPGNI